MYPLAAVSTSTYVNQYTAVSIFNSPEILRKLFYSVWHEWYGYGYGIICFKFTELCKNLSGFNVSHYYTITSNFCHGILIMSCEIKCQPEF